MSLLKKGLKGAPVKRLQAKLGVTADGDFGAGTEKALKDYQKANGLVADGIAGPDTFTKIGLPELVLLRRGTKGEAVKKLQAALGLAADGAYGPATAAAVKKYQSENGLIADGIAGPATLAKLQAIESITLETIAAAEIQPDEEQFESEPLPEIKPSGEFVVASAEAEPEVPAKKSVWQKVTGWI